MGLEHLLCRVLYLISTLGAMGLSALYGDRAPTVPGT